MKLDKEDLDAIADAVYAKLEANAVKVKEAKAADKPATTKPATTKAASKPADKPAEETGPKRDDVYAKLVALGEAKTKDVARGVVQNYAPKFGEVADKDLAALLADIEKAAEETEEVPVEDDL